MRSAASATRPICSSVTRSTSKFSAFPRRISSCPYHSHSEQWEFYYVLAGRGVVRDATGRTPIETGDAFIFKPGEAHQIFGGDAEELVVMCIADNPIGESWYYPG